MFRVRMRGASVVSMTVTSLIARGRASELIDAQVIEQCALQPTW